MVSQGCPGTISSLTLVWVSCVASLLRAMTAMLAPGRTRKDSMSVSGVMFAKRELFARLKSPLHSRSAGMQHTWTGKWLSLTSDRT